MLWRSLGGSDNSSLLLNGTLIFIIFLAQPLVGRKIVLSGGVGTGPAEVVRAWGNAFQSIHPDEVVIDQWLTGGSAALEALVGQVDCKKKFQGHPSLCSSFPVENSTSWGIAGLTFPHSWYSEHRALGLQLLPSVVGGICIVYSKDVTGNLGSEEDAQLNMSFEVIAEMLAGRIIYWDDLRLQGLNPNIVLHHERITALVRSDESSLNEHLTTSIDARVQWWSQVPGFLEEAVGKKPRWPLQNYSDATDPHYLLEAGQQAMLVRMLRTPFSFTFLDFETVSRFSELVASVHILNDDGKPVKASAATIQHALGSHAAELQNSASTLAVNLHLPSDPRSYPLVRVMYWYVKKSAAANPECYKAWLLKEMIIYSYSEPGKHIAEDHGWERPPSSVVMACEARLSEMMCIDGETGKEMPVVDYVPPRYRRCSQGQFLKHFSNMSGIDAYRGCENCSQGFFQSSDAGLDVFECTPSPRGTMTPHQGQAYFTACPPGTYQDELGKDHCKLCPAGEYNPGVASSSCFPCPLGTSTGNLQGLGTCSLCPRSTFSNGTGAASCEPCPLGLVTLGEGHRNSTDCSCPPGFMLAADGLRCRACPEYLSCLGFGAEVQASPGYMLFVPDAQAPMKHSPPQGTYMCKPARRCPGGPPGACNAGAIGFACATCPDGEYLVQNACKECSSTLGVWALMVWIAFVVVAACGVCILVMKLASSSGQVSPKFHLLAMLFHSILHSVQVLGFFAMVVQDVPDEFSFQEHLSIFILDLRKVLGAECWAWSSTATLVTMSSVVPLAVATVAIVFMIDKMVGSDRFPRPHALNLIGGVVWAGVVPLSLFGLTPMMCYGHPAGVHSLSMSPHVLCGSEDHYAMLGFGIPALLMSLAFLVLMVWVSWIAPSRKDKDFFVSTNFLFMRVHPRRWYWANAHLVRSLLMSLTPVLFAGDTKLQCAMCALILLLFGHFHVSTWPLRVPAQNWLEAGTVMLFTLAMICAACALPASPGVTELSTLWNLYAVLIMACLVVVGTSSLLCCGMGAFWKVSPAFWTDLLFLQSLREHKYCSIMKDIQSIAGLLNAIDPMHLLTNLEALEIRDLDVLLGGMEVLQILTKPVHDEQSQNPARDDSQDTRRTSMIPSSTSLNGAALLQAARNAKNSKVMSAPEWKSPVPMLE